VVSIERGYDPRDFALVAFGGAGALHACELAEALSIPKVVVPALPGALSALGILVSDVVKDFSRTVVWTVASTLPKQTLDAEFRALETRARDEFAQEEWRGKLELRRRVDVRYRGQGFELNLPYTNRTIDEFHLEHKRRYGYAHPGREIEIVTLRLRATIPVPRVKLRVAEETLRVAATKEKVWFAGKAVATAILDRASIRTFRGPAIVTEYSATTVVPAGWSGRRDAAGNLVLRVSSR
jgi:N-methylhydantoinase A